LLQQATEDCYRAHILPLKSLEREIAQTLWPNPDVLLQKIKPFLFRHNLKMQPVERDVDEERQVLDDDINTCKKFWLDENISELIRNSRFHGGRKTVLHLNRIEDHCRSGSLDIKIWEPWTKALLKSATTSKTVKPAHHIFDLIESIWQRQHIHSQIEVNLWHQVMAHIRENLKRYKDQFGQLTLDDLLTRVHDALYAHQAENRDETSGGAPAHNLARRLRNRYPVAMIDEFQDTDDIQYEIFGRIYPDQQDHNLFFIGDPKQAIYQFRGADIYTYINAKRHIGDDVFSLSTNWRSTEPLVAAVNHLFHKQDIFGDDQDIPFEPALPNPIARATPEKFVVNGTARAPITIGTIDGALRVDQVRRLAMNHAAEETACLLNDAAEGRAQIAGNNVTAGQIAFLVRGWQDARAARQALSSRNIRSVYVTLESVLLSDTADDLKLILQAVLEPSNERTLKAALATNLMQASVSEIDALSHDVLAQQSVIHEFHEYHQLWETMAVAPMIERLIIKRQIAEKWFHQQDGERQITNLRHLAEILQQRSTVAPGMFRLIKWFSREKQAAETVAVEERQLRLESDRNLVQIVTMHASKGLEYDIVMIPMAGFVAMKPGKANPVLLHQAVSGEQGYQSFETILDLSRDPLLRVAAYEENLAEDMRLLYVAVTRARYHCYLGLPLARNTAKTALGKALAIPDKKEQDEMVDHLASLPRELFQVTSIETVSHTLQTDHHSISHLVAPPTVPRITDHWRVHSYTGLSRLIQNTEQEQTLPITEPGFSDDDAGALDTLPFRTADARTVAISRFTFPRGPRIGVALHDMLESLDFNAQQQETEIAAQRLLDRVPIVDKEKWLTTTGHWIKDILGTAMNQNHPFALQQIPRNKRLNELEFHFPATVTNRFIETLQTAGYLDSAATLSINNLNGMMTGFIDLVVEHENRYYLIDYKSNDLGPAQDDYSTACLSDAIRHHQYDLQYLIYCVALNRYLGQRLADYQYDRDFGGVCYLFLRGMTGRAGDGIFFDKPDQHLLEQLDQLMSTQS